MLLINVKHSRVVSVYLELLGRLFLFMDDSKWGEYGDSKSSNHGILRGHLVQLPTQSSTTPHHSPNQPRTGPSLASRRSLCLLTVHLYWVAHSVLMPGSRKRGPKNGTSRSLMFHQISSNWVKLLLFYLGFCYLWLSSTLNLPTALFSRALYFWGDVCKQLRVWF